MATKKKIVIKKATKKVAKKATKKAALLHAAMPTLSKAYIIGAERGLKNNPTLLMLDAIDYLKQFSVGDVVNWRLDDWSEEMTQFYYRVGKYETPIEVRYSVAYKDSRGFPHLALISPKNAPDCTGQIDVFSYIDEMINNGGFDDEKIKVEQLILHDSSFLDATILQNGEFDPLAELHEAQANAEKKLKLMVENYYNLKDHNKKLRLYTGGDAKNAIKFIDQLNIGDVVYCETKDLGNLTVKLKQDDLLVFQKGKRAYAMSLEDLSNHTFYSQKPIYIEPIDKDLLARFKPNSK